MRARTLLPSAVLILSTVVVSTLPMFLRAAHPVCAAKAHDCAKAPALTTGCCGDDQSAPSNGAPVQARVSLGADLSLVPAVIPAGQLELPPHARIAVHASPPHQHSTDRPTLFAALLI